MCVPSRQLLGTFSWASKRKVYEFHIPDTKSAPQTNNGLGRIDPDLGTDGAYEASAMRSSPEMRSLERSLSLGDRRHDQIGSKRFDQKKPLVRVNKDEGKSRLARVMGQSRQPIATVTWHISNKLYQICLVA